jgi:hypothetical protein
VANGLFGLPWLRTYQEIDISARSLVNVLEFEGVACLTSSLGPNPIPNPDPNPNPNPNP